MHDTIYNPQEMGRLRDPPTHRPRRILVADPPMGGKAWLLAEKGLFVLEEGPGILRTIACTHAGAGNLEAIDGIPDANGFFAMGGEVPEPQPIDFPTPGDYQAALIAWSRREGRPIYRANPIVMGSWMLDGGFIHGLTIRAAGGHASTSAIATVVWVPHRVRK